MFDNLIIFFNEVVNIFENIGSFLWSLIQFIIFALKTLLNLVGTAFEYVFSVDLFNGIGNVIEYLSYFLGIPGATIFISLFLISILLIFVGFIFKVIKGQVQYKSSIKKFLK